MSSIESQIVQLFDRKTQIINQLKHQQLLYDQHLASKLLIQGISPPSWLLPNSHLTALNKEDLISGLLHPRPGPATSFPGGHGFLYDKPVLAVNDSVADEASDGNRLSSNGCDEDVSSAIPDCHVHDPEDGAEIVAPSHVDISACALNYVPMSPDDHSNTRTCNTQPLQEQSLVRILRSRSRQKALVVRNSADASSKSRLGITNNVDSLSQNKSCQGDEQLNGPKESLEWVRSLSLSTEISHKEEASLNVRSFDASKKEVAEVHIGDNQKGKNSHVFAGRNTRSSSQCRLGITNEVGDFSQNRSCQGDELLNGSIESLDWVRSLSMSTEVCHKEEASINLRSLDVSGCLSTKFANNEVKEVHTGDNRKKKKSSSVFVGRNTRSSSQCQQSKDDSFESGTRGYFTQPDGSRELIKSDEAFALPTEICFEKKEGIKTCSAERSGDVRSISLSRNLTVNNDSGGHSAKKICQGYEQVNEFREPLGLFKPFSLPAKVSSKEEGIRTRSRNRSWQGVEQLNAPRDSLEWVRSHSLSTEICHEEKASINVRNPDVVSCEVAKTRTCPTEKSTDACHISLFRDLEINKEVAASSGKNSTDDHEQLNGQRESLELSKPFSLPTETCNKEEALIEVTDGCFDSRETVESSKAFASPTAICLLQEAGVESCSTKSSSGACNISLSKYADIEAEEGKMGNNRKKGNNSCVFEGRLTRSRSHSEQFMDAPSSSKTHGYSEQFDGSTEICKSKSSGPPIEICSGKEAEVGPCLTKGSCDDSDISLTKFADSKANDGQTRHDVEKGKSSIVSFERITTSKNGCQSPSRIPSSRQTYENEEHYNNIRGSVELVKQTALPMGNFSNDKSETDNREPENQEDSGVNAINTMTREHEQLEVKTVLVSPVMRGAVINLANGQDVIDSNSAGHMTAKSTARDCEKSQQPGKKLKHSIVSPEIERVPKFEMYGPPSFLDEVVYNEIPNLSTPVSPFPASCKLYLQPGIYSSVPDGLLENFGLRSNLWPSRSVLQRKSHSDLFSFPLNQRGMDSRKPFLSPIGKGVESMTSKSGGSEVNSGNSRLTCFTIMEDPESSEEDGNECKTVLEETDSSSKSNSIREPLSDITGKKKASLVPDNAIQKRSSESINTEFSFTEICNVDTRFNAMSHRRSRRTTKGKENKSLSVVGNSFKKNSKALSNRFSKPKLSGQSSLRIREQSMSDKEPKRNNIVSNVKSFVPLVQQKQAAAAAAPVKRDVKVKALEAAEAAKRLAEKKENERKQKKEALKTERARLEQENLKQMELAKKLKEEAKKKRGAENAAKKRQREEDEKKEKERKRKRVEDARFQQKQAEEKIQAWREKERTLEGKELNKNAEKESDKSFEASISIEPVTDLVDRGSAKTEADDGIPIFNDHKIIEPSDIGKVDSIVTAESSTPNTNRSGNQISQTSEEEPYDISPYQCSDDDEDDDEIPNKKHIPSWTSKSSILLALSSLQHLDPDTIFPPGSFCSMDEVLVPRRLSQNSRK